MCVCLCPCLRVFTIRSVTNVWIKRNKLARFVDVASFNLSNPFFLLRLLDISCCHTTVRPCETQIVICDNKAKQQKNERQEFHAKTKKTDREKTIYDKCKFTKRAHSFPFARILIGFFLFRSKFHIQLCVCVLCFTHLHYSIKIARSMNNRYCLLASLCHSIY